MNKKCKSPEVAAGDICGRALDEELNSAFGADGKVYLLGEYTDNLHRLVSFMEGVLNTDEVPYVVTVLNGKTKVKAASPLARHFLGFKNFFELYATDLDYSPDIALFFDCLLKHRIRVGWFNHPGFDYGSETEGEIANDFVQFLRAEAETQDVRKRLASWRRNANKNLVRIRQYVDLLFERHARLEVLRVDLLYREACVDDQSVVAAGERLFAASQKTQCDMLDGKRTVRENLARIDVRTAKDDMAHFLRNMRNNSIFDDMVGYIWKLEYSRWSGYHFHCVFFYDGSKVQKGAYHARRIGEYWSNTITRARGFAHNCNLDQRRYRNWGIGRVDYDDAEKRVKLDQALAYLAKREQYVRVKPGSKCRVFQTGVVKQKSTAGRPRTKVILWDEMLAVGSPGETFRSLADVELFDTALPDVDEFQVDVIAPPGDVSGAADEEAA
ncbi:MULTISPECIES: inovirus-type Gp2 protein [unclassified Caballeronia]|uniref:YagK/YfjJ domain-containing protein n=1 Tax=unclassified Caballeronia TaxID=2646786 RepID=UPI002027715B|nr:MULTISPECIES: inovirus-type Gp2 protein [unclassified Caballeronia]